MRLTPCIALAAAAFACGAPAETINRAPLDFGQARLCAHQQAAMLKVHAAETARREHDTEASRSLHGPKVTLDVRYLEGRKTVSLGKMKIDALGGTKTGNPMIDGMLASFPPVNLDLGMGMKLDGPRAVVGMELPIYTGGAISAKVAAGEASVHESRAQEQAERNQIDVKLAQKYFGVQLAESIVRLRRETLAQQEKEVKRARKFEKAGMISRIERMSVEVSRDAAKRELLSSKTDLKVARAELSELLKDKNPGRLATPLFVLRDDLGTAESWQTKALGASPLLTAADSRRRMAEQGVNAAKAAWHPQVYAFAQGNLIKHYLSLTEPDWVAGVGVKFTLWSNRDRMASLHSAEAVVAKADAAMSETRSQLAVGVETAWLRSVQARDQHKLTVSTLELAQENLKLRTKAFAEGLGTALDVSEARSKLLGAQIARKVAAYRFVVAWATLHAIAGDTEGFVDSAARSTNTIER